MTIEEIRRAKQEAEERIREARHVLVDSGVIVYAIDVRTVPCAPFGLPPRHLVDRVSIELRLP